MAQIFKDNDYPQHMYKAGVQGGRYVHNKQQRQEALGEGFQDNYVYQEYPKWVGPHDDYVPHLLPHPVHGGMEDVGQQRLVKNGGKVCNNREEEDAHLAVLASQAPADPEPARAGKRGKSAE